MPKRILSIDTSSSQCLVALRPWADDRIISESHEGAREHATMLLPLIDKLLAQAQLSLPDLDAIAFARGPGSFTGVRLAACAVQGLAYGAGLPVVAVSSLAALAQTVSLQRPDASTMEDIMVAVNAHMGELFGGHFSVDKTSSTATYICLGEEILVSEAGLAAWHDAGEKKADRTVLTAGNGWAIARMSVDADIATSPEGLLQQVDAAFEETGGVSAADALPAYLRGADAWQKTSSKPVLKP